MVRSAWKPSTCCSQRHSTARSRCQSQRAVAQRRARRQSICHSLSTWKTALRTSDNAYFYSGSAAVAQHHLNVPLRHRSLQWNDAEGFECDSLVVHVEKDSEHV